MTRFLLAALAGGMLALTSFLPAQAAPMDDKLFIQTAIGVNLEEIQMGQLAQQKSQNSAVKAYGQTLVKDHIDNNMKATAIAMKVGATVPTKLSPDAQKAYDMLAGMSGTAFDQMFLSHMVMGHTMAIQMFTAQEASKNSDVAAFAQMSLPVLNMHLTTAKMLQMTAGGRT